MARCDEQVTARSGTAGVWNLRLEGRSDSAQQRDATSGRGAFMAAMR